MKNRNHWAWREFSRMADIWIFFKFLWLIHTWNGTSGPSRQSHHSSCSTLDLAWSRVLPRSCDFGWTADRRLQTPETTADVFLRHIRVMRKRRDFFWVHLETVLSYDIKRKVVGIAEIELVKGCWMEELKSSRNESERVVPLISVVPNRFYLWYWKTRQMFHRLLGKKGEAVRWSRALLNTSLKSLGTPLMVGLMLAGGLMDWVYCWQDCTVLDYNWTHLQHTNCRGEDGSKLLNNVHN